jgi:hypothetical protein
VSRLIQRFNAHGLAALETAPGRTPTSTAAQRQQILDVLHEAPEREQDQSGSRTRAGAGPEREQDQSATWSRPLLQRRLRGNGLPPVSRDTIHQTLRQAGYTWQRTRSWRPTGTARRKRPLGSVRVVAPEAEQKRG